MATSTHPNVQSIGSEDYSNASVDLGLDDGANDIDDGADDNDFAATGRDLLIVHNSTGAPVNLLVTSVADRFGRETDPNPLSLAIPAGETHRFGPLATAGWAASNGRIKIQASATGLRAAILQL